ncbi:DNA polymerase [Enterococcus phage EC99P1]|nr:DNA polymerase [Enterococcus phage EC99P1]
MKISVNVTSVSEEKKAKEKIKKASKAKEIPTMEEAWEQIFSRKNSNTDIERLKQVKEWFDNGKIGREAGKESKAFTKAEAMRLYKVIQDMERKEKLAEMATKDWEKYPLISQEAAEQWVENCLNADDDYFAMDFETVGDNGGKYKYREQVAGFSLTYRFKGKIINGYLPILHYKETATGEFIEELRNVSPIMAHQLIKKLFHSPKNSIWHNATFDLGLAKAALGIETTHLPHDTMVIMKLLNENLGDLKTKDFPNGVGYKLKNLVQHFLKIPSDTFDELFGKDAKFGYVPLDAARWYGAKDTHVGFLLFEWQMEILSKPNFQKIKKYYEKIEHPVIYATWLMESEGFVMNDDEIAQQRIDCIKRIKELDLAIEETFGEVNVGSPQQLAKLLYYDHDWSQYVTKNKQSILKGHVGFDDNFISNNGKFALVDGKKLVVNPKVVNGEVIGDSLPADSKAMGAIAKHHEAVQLILDWKDESKHLSAFVEKMDSFIEPDGKLHGDFKQVGTVTLRYAAANPNLQQQPYKARNMFGIDKDSLILSADFSQQEPRLLAHMSRCKALIEIYKQGRDLYSEMASAIFDKPIEECGDGSIWRKRTKVVVLAIMYGMSAWSLAETLGVSKDEGQQMIDDFFKAYPEIEVWINNNQKEVVKNRYVESMWGTRRRFMDENFDILKKAWRDLTPEDKKLRSAANRAMRQTTNFKVQGGAACQTKQVIVAMVPKLKELSEKRGKERCFNLLAQVHDELLFKVPKDVTPEEVAAIEDVMINTVKLVVPSKTDMALGSVWGKLLETVDIGGVLYGVMEGRAKSDVTNFISKGDSVTWRKPFTESMGEVFVNGEKRSTATEEQARKLFKNIK